MEAAKARIDELVKEDQFSGAVLVTKNGKPILSGAYGLADREKKIPNSLNTKFRIGSMNKMFTAGSVFQLVAGGKSKLSEPFRKNKGGYTKKNAGENTLRKFFTPTRGNRGSFWA